MGLLLPPLRNLAENDGFILMLEQFPAKGPFRHGRWIALTRAIAPLVWNTCWWGYCKTIDGPMPMIDLRMIRK
jgi:hypothetical protein